MTRVQANLLARLERQLLTVLCRHLPRWISPNLLTAAGFAGAVAVFCGYVLSRIGTAWLWLAIAGYVVHWFGDSLDGSLARHRGIERPRFGHFLDHSVDALGNMVGMIGLGLTSFVRLDAALLALSGYLLLTIHVLLRMRATGAMQLSFVGGGPTELRLGLVALTGAMLGLGPLPVGPAISAYDLAVGGMGTIFVLIFLWHTGQIAAILWRDER